MARATRSAKRKRAEDDDTAQPPSKILRHMSPIDSKDATAILAILDLTDTQGLLDRVFPVLDHPELSSSLRALLEDNQTLSVLRAAVEHLKPISSLPRAKPSPTAAQQHRFCALAADLLNQVSKNSAPIPPSLESILPVSPSKTRPLKYALVQHLPNQDYWTSLNDDPDLSDALKLLPTAHAELVAILPTPAQVTDKYPVPTLAAYAPSRTLASSKPLPQQRTVSTGAFLDFGPWASFAPSFDHDAQVLGREELGLVLYASHQRKQRRINAPRGSIQDMQMSDIDVDSRDFEPVDLDKELQELLPPEEAAAVKAALGSLELEKAIQELLDRNRRALERLENLQIERLTKDGDHANAEEGSEEWDIAQGILQTLTVLASLRPRTSKSTNTIVPPPAILHKLHRTLAIAPTSGWHGTLPSTHPTALSDDTTFKKSSRAVAPTPAAPSAPTTTTTTTTVPVPVTVTAPVAIPYSGYTYAYGQQGQQPYRPASAATTTTNGQTAAYAQYTPQYYAYAAAAAAAQGQAAGGAQPNYYGQQQQGYAAASYSSWYSAYPQQQQQQGSTSGTSTPQPQGQAQATYGSFFGGTRTPVVANTVYASATAGGTATQTATATALPPHLRAQQQQYYAYQPQQAAASPR